jgi:hypothetical protein
MATNCTNCGCSNLKCGCEDQALTTPIVYPTPTPCPDPQPCSEAFDSQCVYYTKADIICGTDIVVYQNDALQEALIQIVDYFCANIPTPSKEVLPVSITKNLLDPSRIDAVVTGGTAPFTYTWSYAQNVWLGHTFTAATNLSYMTFNTTLNGITTTILGTGLFQTLVQVEVTDANGNYGSTNYLFTSTKT